MRTPKNSTAEDDDGGFGLHVSSRNGETAQPVDDPTNSSVIQMGPPRAAPKPPKSTQKEKGGKKKRKSETQEFDYESHYPGRAPIVLEDRPPMLAGNHPLLATNAPRLDATTISGASSGAQQHSDVIRLSPTSDTDITVDMTSPLRPESNGCQNYVTLTGTIKRGKNQIQEVELKLTQEQLDQMNKSTITMDDKEDGGKCGLRKGLHILLITILYVPLAFIASLAVSFYVGTMCWYNFYLNLSEERTIWHKAFLCPLLIISYPLLTVTSAFGIAIYASVIQISWYLSSWLKQIRDFDKGFYGWVCQKLGVPECAPYEVVVLDDNLPNGISAQHTVQSTV